MPYPQVWPEEASQRLLATRLSLPHLHRGHAGSGAVPDAPGVRVAVPRHAPAQCPPWRVGQSSILRWSWPVSSQSDGPLLYAPQNINAIFETSEIYESEQLKEVARVAHLGNTCFFNNL